MAEGRNRRRDWGVLRDVVPRGTLALLALLSIAGSLTEGLGLLLLVPLLAITLKGAGDGLPAWLQGLSAGWSLEALLIVFVVLLSLRAAIVQSRTLAQARLEQTVIDRLRAQLFAAVLGASWRYLSTLRQGDLLSTTFATVDRTGMAVQYLLQTVTTLVTLGVLLGAALLIAPLPSMAIGAGGLVVLVLYAGLRRRAMLQGVAIGETYAAFFTFFSERLASLRLIKSFGTAEREIADLDRIAGRLRDSRLSEQASLALGQAVLQAGAALVLALVTWLALVRWQVPLAGFLPAVALFARCVPLLTSLQVSWQQWAHYAPSLGELAQVLSETRAAAEQPAVNAARMALSREVRLGGITVRHQGRSAPALDAVSLALPAGSITLLAGASGAGKSTVADLAAGLILPDTGAVTIDDTVLSSANLAAWRREVAYMQQEPVLFDATVRENLLWAAPDADEARLVSALRDASAGFVLDLPQALDTSAGPGGRRLSGGERQRVVLARALLRDPQLLILDEATSALDTANEAAIAEAVARLRGRMTILIIGHRGALADLADRTIHIAEGRLTTPS